MVYTALTNRVLQFIYKAHEGAVDRAGLPYVYHPLAVAADMKDEDSTVVALLHDVIEDTDYTVEDIEALGVSDEAIAALKLLTHDKEVPYMDYVEKIKQNPLAARVKIADLKHNSDLTRLSNITPADKARVEKYKKAQKILRAALPKKTLTPLPVEEESEERFVALCQRVYEAMKEGDGTMSVSLLQRKFGIGYIRSWNVLERLQKQGLITRDKKTLKWIIV